MAASTTVAHGRAPREQSLARKEALTAYAFIAPYLIVAGIFTLGLLVYAFYISLTNLKGTFAPTANFIGINNYIRAVQDSEFLIALGNVVWYFVIVTTLQTIGAILLATLLNTRI